jgi:hypothetical protein
VLEERWYFKEPFTSGEEVEEAYEIVSPSRLEKFQYCPYSYSLVYEQKLQPAAKARQMLAGIAMHKALDYYYSTLDREGSFEFLSEEPWSDPEPWEILLWEQEKKGHGFLTLDHLADQLNRYYDHWEAATDTYPPIDPPRVEDLNMDRVIAAKFRVTPDERVVLGESSILMELPFGDLKLLIAGKPDLPIIAPDGRIYIMDHKTTGSWISGWFWKRFEADNKMRVYCAMVRDLLGITPNGYIINAICLHANTGKDTFSGTRTRRKKWIVTPSQIEEGVKNEYATFELIRKCREINWWPQWCDRCRHPELCGSPPEERGVALNLEWKERESHGFFNL